MYAQGQEAGTLTIEVVFAVDPSALEEDYIKAPDTNGKLIIEPK